MSFANPEQIAQFEQQEQVELQQFVQEQIAAVVEIERVADAHKFREAELKQQQKLLRIEINARAKELSFVAKYCGIARERAVEVDDAERTLRMLQTQLQHVGASARECSPSARESETPGS